MHILYRETTVPVGMTLAFSSKCCLPAISATVGKVFESFAIHRLENMKDVETAGSANTPVLQIGHTIKDYVTNHQGFTDICNLQDSAYKPETLSDKVAEVYTHMEKHAGVIPFILVFNQDDCKHILEAPTIVHILAGFGEFPTRNFIMITMDMQPVLRVFNVSDDEGSSVDVVYYVPPIYIDTEHRTIVKMPQIESALDVRTFINAPAETGEIK